MKKNLIKTTLLFVLLIFSSYVFFLLGKVKEVLIIDYTDLIIKEKIELEIYNKYKVSEFVEIEDGKLLNDRYIDTLKIGENKFEINYLNKDKEKRKSYVKYEVIDTTKPIILGSSKYTVVRGSKPNLEYMMISLDNYTKTPERKIEGKYDLNTIGDYKLKFIVTDQFGNSNIKDFTLSVVQKTSPSRPITTKTNYDDIVKLHKNANTMIGLDISKWQGDVDFDKLKEKNVEFIMIRVGYQNGIKNEYVLDNKFERNIKEANRVGIPVGIYLYSYATSLKIAEEQALWVVEQIKKYKVDLPVVFDFEDWAKFPTYNLSQKDINDIAIKFMETLEKNGYKGMNYSSKYYLENIWNIEDYPTWLAHYTTSTNYKGKYSMWQLCQDGRISGINGAVDINVLYDKSLFIN